MKYRWFCWFRTDKRGQLNALKLKLDAAGVRYITREKGCGSVDVEVHIDDRTVAVEHLSTVDAIKAMAYSVEAPQPEPTPAPARS